MATQPARSDAPNPAIKRLSLYLRQLESLLKDDVATVSSRTLAQRLDLTDAQVRKDLAYFGQFGKPGVGYHVEPLILNLRGILGTDRIRPTILVGVGNLGRALATYQGFQPKGFELVALFDTHPKKVGKKIGGLVVQSLGELEETVAAHQIRLAILTLPADAAQDVADRLVEVGIRAILNFTPLRLNVPKTVAARSVDLAVELEQLNFTLSE